MSDEENTSYSPATYEPATEAPISEEAPVDDDEAKQQDIENLLWNVMENQLSALITMLGSDGVIDGAEFRMVMEILKQYGVPDTQRNQTIVNNYLQKSVGGYEISPEEQRRLEELEAQREQEEIDRMQKIAEKQAINNEVRAQDPMAAAIAGLTGVSLSGAEKGVKPSATPNIADKSNEASVAAYYNSFDKKDS